MMVCRLLGCSNYSTLSKADRERSLYLLFGGLEGYRSAMKTLDPVRLVRNQLAHRYGPLDHEILHTLRDFGLSAEAIVAFDTLVNLTCKFDHNMIMGVDTNSFKLEQV
jgi:hypothetical protein